MSEDKKCDVDFVQRQNDAVGVRKMKGAPWNAAEDENETNGEIRGNARSSASIPSCRQPKVMSAGKEKKWDKLCNKMTRGRRQCER